MHFVHTGVEEGEGQRERVEQIGQLRGMEAELSTGEGEGDGDDGLGSGREGEEDISRPSTSCLDTDVLGCVLGGGGEGALDRGHGICVWLLGKRVGWIKLFVVRNGGRDRCVFGKSGGRMAVWGGDLYVARGDDADGDIVWNGR